MSLRIGDTAPNFKAQTSIGDIDFYEYLGDSWSFDRQSAINFANNQARGNVLLTAKINQIDVDWKSSIDHYINFSGNYDGYDENELKVNGFKVYDVETELI